MYITLDVGGTSIRVAGFLSLTNSPSPLFLEKFQHEDTYEKDLSVVLSIIEKQRRRVVDAVCVATAGIVDKSQQRLVKSPNLPSWNNSTPATDLAKQLSTRGFLINDAVAGALGEAEHGLRPERDFFYLVWGTGLGGAVCKNEGETWTATDIEPGHRVLLVDSLNHERHETWERLNGGAAIEARFGFEIQALPEVSWDTVEREMTDGIRSVVEREKLELVVVNGGVALEQKQRVKEIQDLLHEVLPEINITFASQGDSSGLYGGLSIIRANL